jgi:hypothetical protein
MRDKARGSPPRTGSKLDPHWPEIAELRGSGCTLAGLRNALASRNVDVSISRLCTYIHHREEAQGVGAKKIPAQACMTHSDADEDPLAMLLLSQIKAQALGMLNFREVS